MARIVDIALQKIRDTAGKLGKNVSSGVTNYINQNTIFANPTSNNGQNYWSSPAAQGLANVQRYIENPNTPLTHPIPEISPFQQRNVFQGSGSGAKIGNTAVNLPGQVGNLVANIPGGIFNSIIGKGVVAPTLDITQNVGKMISGKDLTPYEQLHSGASRLGYQIAGTKSPEATRTLGIKQGPKQTLGNIASTADPLLNAYLLNTGVGNVAAKGAAEKTLLDAIKSGAFQGAKYGTAFGTVGGLESSRNIESDPEYALNLFTNILGGTAGGAVLGGTMAGVSGFIANVIRGFKPKASNAEIYTDVNGYIRNRLGRFAGQLVGKEPVQTEVAGGGIMSKGKLVKVAPNKYVTESKVPEYYKQIDEKLGIPEDFDIRKIDLGNSVKPLTAKEHNVNVSKAGLYDTKGIFKNTTDISNYDDLLAGRPGGADVSKSAKVVMMTPDEYLAQIPKSKPTQSSIDFMKSKLAKGEKLPMPTLDYSGGGFTQEGRNRAYLAKELGVTEMPVLKVENLSKPPSGKVTTDMSGIQNRMESVVNQKTQDITSKLNIEPQTTSINGQSNAQPILALPKPKYEVGTKAELKKILAKDPNANVKIVMKSSGKVRPMTAESVPDRADVAATIPNRLNNFIEDVLGYSTKEPKGGKREAGGYTKLLRKGQEAITTKVEQGLASDNNIIRNGASILQDFFKGIGMSPERAKASNALKGEIVNANTRAYDVTTTLYDMLPKKGRKASMARINSVLDPELSKTKVTFDDLTTKEKGVYTLIREGLDLVHDTSYANGHISPELYVKNKGNYTPRMYDVMESPPEVNQFLNQGKRIDNSLYKQRGITDEWKQEHNLDNPIYALGKRLAQVETNSAIKRYTDFLATNPNYVSDVAKPGYTKLSDSPAYGSLADKWVLNSAAEDLKGFFFANQGLQNLYDVFRAYDRMGVRQLQKKLLTVFNPTTNVGNIVSDNVFGFLTGVDPATLNKNLYNIKRNPKEFKALNDYLTRKNVTSTDITRTDFVNWLGKIDSLKEGQAVTDNIPKKVQKFYAGTDDAYKVAAFKSLLDKGFTLEEATRKVADGFQNYSNVGKFYDVWAKTPIIGKPFVKFQGDLIRIIKNGVVNNPLGLIGFLGTLKGISILSSKLSGETDEDRKTREDRYASPKIPGLNISLAWQTPWGEFNVARYISPFYANNETTNMASNMIPFVPNIDKDRDVASNIAMNVNDPLVSPFIQLAVNRDFRGKRIADPDANKYQETTLTPTEQLINQGKWFGRAYLPPPANSAIDVASVAGGGTDMYGRKQTLGQSIARLGGIKVTQFGPEEAAEQRAKDAEYAQKGNEYIDKQISTVQKQQLQGKITEEEAKNRIDYLNSQKEGTPTISNGGGGEYKYIDDSDTLRTINTKKIALMPETTEYQKALKRNEAYKLVDNILDSTLSTDKQSEALSDLGISPEQATYYNIARQPNDLKSIYVQEEINNMMSTTKDRGQMLEYLVTLRQEIGGETILTSGVIDYLNDQGLISDSEASYLKRVDSTGGKIKLTGRGSKVTIKKVSLPESSKVTAPKIKDMGDLLKMKGSKVKPKMKKYKLTVYNKL